MTEIELVIKMSQESYNNLKTGCIQRVSDGEMIEAIKNGTPLPKGHGRLIDADRMALLSDLFCYTKYTGIDEAPYEDATKALEFAPTIIEADKVERSDKE